MNKQQWIVALTGIILLFSLFFFGRTKPESKGIKSVAQKPGESAHQVLTATDILSKARESLTPGQSARVTALENAISRGDLQTQKILVYGQLAAYWRDSVQATIPWLYYSGEKAKLEKSEKSLNFAAHSYLDKLRGVQDHSLKTWMAVQAKDLFTESLAINPANDSAKVGLGSTWFFGAGGDGPPMEGIMKIREVAEKDPKNMYAQFMLGYGSMISGQLDKAAERFQKVVDEEPGNTEAVFLLAETYENLGDKAKAVKYYSEAAKMVNNPDLLKAIDEKIKSLQ